ncbi:MAG TPA: DUF2007 domain-containing protein [Rhodospirillales bacterium]|nr:DUF2007 domain-containing protein [Rhodospirillales bacterium]
MIELIRSENPVLISWLEMRLGEAGIKAHVLDAYTASAYGGALAAVQRRIMIDEDDLPRARRLLEEAANAGAMGPADG